MKRKDGYYRVQLRHGEWIIAQWEDNEWATPGSASYYNDDYFAEINETRINPEP